MCIEVLLNFSLCLHVTIEEIFAQSVSLIRTIHLGTSRCKDRYIYQEGPTVFPSPIDFLSHAYHVTFPTVSVQLVGYSYSWHTAPRMRRMATRTKGHRYCRRMHACTHAQYRKKRFYAHARRQLSQGA